MAVSVCSHCCYSARDLTASFTGRKRSVQCERQRGEIGIELCRNASKGCRRAMRPDMQAVRSRAALATHSQRAHTATASPDDGAATGRDGDQNDQNDLGVTRTTYASRGPPNYCPLLLGNHNGEDTPSQAAALPRAQSVRPRACGRHNDGT